MSLTRFLRDARGTSAVEFAIVAPIFFMVVFGVIDGGRLMWTQVGLQHAVEMAARCASLQTAENPDPCPGSSVQGYAAQQAFGLNLPPGVFTVGTAECGVNVSASYEFQFFSSYLGVPPLTLSARSCSPT